MVSPISLERSLPTLCTLKTFHFIPQQDQVAILIQIRGLSVPKTETQEVRSGREHSWAPISPLTSEPNGLWGQEPVAGAAVFSGLLCAGDGLPEVLTEAFSSISTMSGEQDTFSFHEFECSYVKFKV